MRLDVGRAVPRRFLQYGLQVIPYFELNLVAGAPSVPRVPPAPLLAIAPCRISALIRDSAGIAQQATGSRDRRFEALGYDEVVVHLKHS